MRHRNKLNKLGRTSSHRKATMRNIAGAIVQHEQIRTTLAKAKAAQGFVERLISYGKKDTVAARRLAFKYLQNHNLVKKLFDEIAPTFADRNGGYTRIIRLGQRRGDGAELAVLQLVGFEPMIIDEKKPSTKKAGKKAAGKKKAEKPAEEVKTEAAEEKKEAVEEKKETAEEKKEAAAPKKRTKKAAKETASEKVEAAAEEKEVEKVEEKVDEKTEEKAEESAEEPQEEKAAAAEETKEAKEEPEKNDDQETGAEEEKK